MRTKNVQSELDLDDVLAVPASVVKRPNQYLLSGDTLVSSANSWNLVGKCAWVGELPWTSTFGGFVTALRAQRDKVDPRYLYRWFASPHTQAILRSFGRKTTSISNLSLDQTRRMTIPLPPIEEQRRIAAVLDQADELRAKRRTALALLDALTESIFLDMFGDDGTGTSWPMVSLGEIIADAKLGLVRASRELDDGHPHAYVRMNAIGPNGDLDLSSLRRTRATESEAASYGLRDGDLLFNTRNSRDLVGKSAVYRGPTGALFNNNLLRLRFREDLRPDYLGAVMLSREVQRQLDARKSGTTSVFAIYAKDLRTVTVPLPPPDLQDRFAGRTSAVREEQELQLESLQCVDLLFASLQQRAFRGEL